jgi:hypothetical protein
MSWSNSVDIGRSLVYIEPMAAPTTTVALAPTAFSAPHYPDLDAIRSSEFFGDGEGIDFGWDRYYIAREEMLGCSGIKWRTRMLQPMPTNTCEA